MRAFPMPSGGLIFPSYYNNGNAAFMDTSLSWNELAVQFPSEYCQIDSSGAIHCVVNSGTSFTHYKSTDGAVSWENFTYDMGDVATQIDECFLAIQKFYHYTKKYQDANIIIRWFYKIILHGIGKNKIPKVKKLLDSLNN